jgi:hypothetical protein
MTTPNRTVAEQTCPNRWTRCVLLAFPLFLFPSQSDAVEIVALSISSSNTNRFAIYESFDREEDFEKITNYISRHSNNAFDREVYLDVRGGKLAVGLKLGRWFRERSIRTLTMPGGACESACAIAFLGGYSAGSPQDSSFPLPAGPDRTRTRESNLCFHYSFSRITARQAINSQALRDRLMEMEEDGRSTFYDFMNYFEEMNVSWKLLQKMVGTKHNEYYCIDRDFHEYNIKDDGISIITANQVREAYISARKKRSHDGR